MSPEAILLADLILIGVGLALIVAIVLAAADVIGEEWWPAMAMTYVLVFVVFITVNFLEPALT